MHGFLLKMPRKLFSGQALPGPAGKLPQISYLDFSDGKRAEEGNGSDREREDGRRGKERGGKE